MMYVVKVGEHYVKAVNMYGDYLGEVHLSKEIMRDFNEKTAKLLAKELNGKVVEIQDEVSMDWEQLSLFDKEE